MAKPVQTKPRGSSGRPKAEKVKSQFVTFRVTEEELVHLMDKAGKSGMSHGEYARNRALRGIVQQKKQALLADHDRALFHEARRQGVNLNQIAHHCNRHLVPPPSGFETLLVKLNALWDKILASP